ncbi:NAD(P)(+) transhydrogenase (Re/Si-specific) subunit beta [Rubrivirga marina]|uniref:NAD(P) transhydrogenase subunit beta n=1 Tax=Rubrivirga marina TaxID=1196024 RepID=A0A271IYD0_9BACT|nr:NAD(P)(+) transhydrogenase (Re/Si-specific) subunit beta [Rubrivirga marina]PAP75529.1 NAD synthetase [Rubrivirga marina]
MIDGLVTLAYLVAASLFILGLKRLSSPRTARAGNRMAAVGMLIGVVAALLSEQILNPVELVGGLAVGSVIGVFLARRTPLTEMPELVAAFNGFGGAASALVAAAEVLREMEPPLRDISAAGETVVNAPGLGMAEVAVVAASVLIGSVTLSGSFVAWGKLKGKRGLSGFPGLRMVSILVGLGVLAVGALFVTSGDVGVVFPATGASSDGTMLWLAALGVLSLVLGVLLVLPIGGADMPVVVALLNAYSGLAAAATGFVLGNYALVISGALVGASGLILTRIMCEAMNRSLANVLLGGFGAAATTSSGGGDSDQPPVQSTTADDAAVMMAYAGRVVIVPGYGLAVAQAQHEVRELVDLLQKEGVEVSFAIHPVAGRMPGHMNVLLAEANVPYDQLIEMDEINPEMGQVDVVLVVGANDVVNPAAREDETSPIYGMPIINVDEAQQVIVLKRSMRTGYAGIENPLFFKPNTQMLFGDAKETVKAVIGELKTLQAA